MNLGKKTTCGHCGAEFSFMLDKHDAEDCFDHLRAEVARLQKWIKWCADINEPCSAPEDFCLHCDALAALRGGGE